MRRSLLLLALLVCSCGDDSEPCRIRPSDVPGFQILECPSGAVRLIGGNGAQNCVSTLEEEGWRRITCEDGTSVLIDPEGNVHFPGSGAIQGVVLLEGKDGDHSGTVVRAVGTPFKTETDAEGFFRLPDLPAGLYRLVFEYPGRVPVTVRNIPVVNGTYTLDPVQLSFGLRLSSELNAQVIGSPTGDSLLVHEFESHSHRLSLLRLDDWEFVHLSSNAVEPQYRFDGRQVLWTENLSSRSRVYIYDLDTGERRELPVRGTRACFFPDGRAVLVAQEEEGVHELAIHDLVTGETAELGSWEPSSVFALRELRMGPDGGSVVYHSGMNTVLFDRENGELVVLANTRLPPNRIHFAPSGRKVIFERPGVPWASLVLVDLSRGDTRLLGEEVDGLAMEAPDGSLVWQQPDGWRRWEETTDKVEVLPLSSTPRGLVDVVFLPDGTGLVHWEFPAVTLLRWDEDRPRLLSMTTTAVPRVTADSRHVVMNDVELVDVYTRVVRVEDGKSVRLEGDWMLGPDPGWMVRHADNALRYYDLDTGDTGEIHGNVLSWSFLGDDALAFRARPGEPNVGSRLAIWDASTRKTTWLLEGEIPLLSRNGRYAFFRSSRPGSVPESPGSILVRYDRETGIYDRAMHDILPLRPDDRFERFLLFRVPEGNDAGLYLARAVP